MTRERRRPRWNAAYKLLQPLSVGVGVAIIGCTATKLKDEVKLNIWPDAHVSTGLVTETLTAAFNPGQDLASLAEGEARPICAEVLADAIDQSGTKVVQIIRATMDPPLQEEFSYAKDGRRFIKSCRFRDRTGRADVEAVCGAVQRWRSCQRQPSSATGQALPALMRVVQARPQGRFVWTERWRSC